MDHYRYVTMRVVFKLDTLWLLMYRSCGLEIKMGLFSSTLIVGLVLNPTSKPLAS